jgi:outer membrane protein OmpA-like peptidoglycan-associated protein
MKLIKLSALLVLALAVSLGTTGCKKKNRGITPIPNARVSRPQDQGPIFDNTRPVNPNDTGINTTSANPLPTSWTPESVNQDPSRFAPFTVYFAFDSANIRSGEQSKISAVAADLQANPGMVLIIDGHCDERGTEGYNQTLSERRALTLREEVVKLGVNPERILTRGFSEMRPAVDGHDESAWSKNRRGEFIAGTPK